LYVDCNIENGKLKLKRAITDSSLESGPMRRGVQSVHRSGARRAKKGACESLKAPMFLAIDVLFRFFWYFQLFLAYLEK
jgi:hypothetical protein